MPFAVDAAWLRPDSFDEKASMPTTDLARPDDLNGQLISVLLPLRTSPGFALEGASAVTAGMECLSPFLPARGRIEARHGRHWVLKDPDPQFHSWPAAVLVASAEFEGDGSELSFGRSAWTLAEQQPDSQPWRGRPARSASLWWVEQAGLVLALESVETQKDLARRADAAAMLLRSPQSGSAGLARAGLMDDLGFPRESSLRGLFGVAVVEDLSALVDISADVLELAIPRPTVVAGHRLIEGLVVGLGSAPGEDPLGIKKHLLKDLREFSTDDFESNDLWQEAGFRWDYDSVSVVEEPAWKTQGDHPEAYSAARADGRVFVADLNAFSIYHDYLAPRGVGSGVVSELIPLAGYLGACALDEDFVAQALVEATSAVADDELLTKWSRGVSRVRWHLQQRRLQQDNLRNEPNFRAWTVDPAVRRALVPRSLFGEGAGQSRLELLAVGVDALERSLERRIDERRRDTRRLEDELRRANERAEDQRRREAERREEDREKARDQTEQWRQAKIQLTVGLISALGLVGLFAALASLPKKGRLLPELTSAGLWTVFVTSAIGIVTVAALCAYLATKPRWAPGYGVAVGLVALAASAAVSGLFLFAGHQQVLLVVGAVAIGVAPLYALWVTEAAPERPVAPSGK